MSIEEVLSGQAHEDQKIYEKRFTISDVAISSNSGELIAKMFEFSGKIKEIHVKTSSDDFGISIRTKKTVTAPDINEIYNVTNQNLTFSHVDLNQYYINQENPRLAELYIIIDNTSGTQATGVIDLQFIIERA